MWRQAQTLDDARLVLTIRSQCDSNSYTFLQDGTVEKYAPGLVNRWADSSLEQCWIYEDSDKKITFNMMNNSGIGRLTNVCPIGFDPDLFNTCLITLPLIGNKIREIVDAWGMTRWQSTSPHTDVGDYMANLTHIYSWEATVTLDDNGEIWTATYNRDPAQKPQNENLFPVINSTPLDMSIFPAGFVFETLVKNV